ncbi:CYTH domain-containing protein [Candidatus Kaiserbacteria bacterium]|nr:CYTH domain-containing protein [Candidatus Kaiserbacteria bacterium]
MEIEYEATFKNINKDGIRQQLKSVGASLIRPEFLQRRVPLHIPNRQPSDNTWVRVRDEGDKVTMSVKTVSGDKIEDQKETCITVNSFDDALSLLEEIGCKPKSYQENKRELWKIDSVEITIDEWPFLEPFVEIEGPSEEAVRTVSEQLGFNYDEALFCSVTTLYEKKYGVSQKEINETEKITFDIENPFS